MTWVAFDAETTGLEPGSRPIEVAGIAFDDDGTVLDTFSSTMNPGMPIPPDATVVHGIDDALVAAAPDATTVLRNFWAWLPKGATLVGHNAGYDQDVLTCSCQRLGVTMPTGLVVVDTLAMARQDGARGGHRLNELVERHGLRVSGALHRAATDAEATRQYLLLARQHSAPDPRPWVSTWRHPDTVPEVMACLPELIATGHTATCLYRSSSGRVTRHHLVPYGWAELSGGRILLHGLSRGAGRRLSFRADRVVSLTVASDLA
jgi:DNA polymerase III epsilon subunit family exonuclease